MKLKASQQISPRAAAGVILGVLVLVQALWWKFLVVKEKPVNSRMMGGGGGPPQMGPPTLAGLDEVVTTTLSGGLEAGDADGTGVTARFDAPVGLAIDAQGTLYVADSKNHRIRAVSPQGKTTTVAGSVAGFADGDASHARFQTPCGVAVAPDGTLFVADTGNHRIRRIQKGQVTTLAGGSAGYAGGQGSVVRFNMPCSITYVGGATPTLLVADALNRRVRILNLAGQVVGERDNSNVPTAAIDTASAVQARLLAPGGMPASVPMNLHGATVDQAQFVTHRPLATCPAKEGLFVIDANHNGVFYVSEGRAELLAGRATPKAFLSGWNDQKGAHTFFGRLGGIATDGKGHIYVSDTGNNMIRCLTIP